MSLGRVAIYPVIHQQSRPLKASQQQYSMNIAVLEEDLSGNSMTDGLKCEKTEAKIPIRIAIITIWVKRLQAIGLRKKEQDTAWR